MRRLRAAVVGCGRIGHELESLSFGPIKPRTHVACHVAHPGVDLVAVADVDFQKAQSVAGLHSCAVFRDMQQLLKFSGELDVLSICTPQESHARDVIEAVGSGHVRAIWCEKPIACSVVDAEEMRSVCERFGAGLFVNTWRRCNEAYERLAMALAEKAIGEIERIFCEMPAGFVNAGTHVIDAIAMLVGKLPTAVRATLMDHESCDPAGRALLRFGESDALIESRFSSRHSLSIVVEGTRGIARIDEDAMCQIVMQCDGLSPSSHASSTSSMLRFLDVIVSQLTRGRSFDTRHHGNAAATILRSIVAIFQSSAQASDGSFLGPWIDVNDADSFKRVTARRSSYEEGHRD